MNGCLLLEGADSSGKTTLATVLRERYGARYMHGSVHRDPWQRHVATIRRALRLVAAGNLVVIDRNWISHLVYGGVFNNQMYDEGARDLDRILRAAGAVTVLCVPGDPRRQEADWLADRAEGKREHFSSVREVIALYLDLALGNVARSGAGYLYEMIRYGDFAQRGDVVLYDRYQYNDHPERFAQELVRRLDRVPLSVDALIEDLMLVYGKYCGR